MPKEISDKKIFDKLKENTGWAFTLLYLWLIFSSFIRQDFYAVTGVYATLIIFAVLFLIALFRIDLRKSDVRTKTEIAVFALTAIIATLNLKLINSGMGALFIPTDMVLMLLLVPRIELTDRMRRVIAGSASLLMIYWYAYIHWEYGFNMAGLLYMIIFMTGEIFAEYVKNDFDMQYMSLVQILLFVTTVLITICYHARSAALCVILYGIIWKLLPYLGEKKVLYKLLVAAATFGSLLFTLLYMLMGRLGINLTILYKDILSGRQDIWAELWGALAGQPLTGIGSSYELKSFFIFEVHNGLFDILAVHGIIVFALVIFMLVKRLNETADIHFSYRPDCRHAIAGVFALLFASFFENGFIVPPYSIVFMALLLLGRE